MGYSGVFDGVEEECTENGILEDECDKCGQETVWEIEELGDQDISERHSYV